MSEEVSAADPSKLLMEIARERAFRERAAVTVQALPPAPRDGDETVANP